MIKYSVRDDRCVFDVMVVPRASLSEVVGEYNGSLRVRIAAPPVDGAANSELIRILAKVFGVTKSDVTILSGKTGKHKRVAVRCTELKIKEALQRFQIVLYSAGQPQQK